MRLKFYRPTWAEIDLDALEYNFGQVRKLVGQKVKIMVTVKADAYGHGIVPVSRALAIKGVDYLGVASIDEGITLRKARINLPILILGTVLPNDVEPILKYNLTQTVCTEELAYALDKEAGRRKQNAAIHIKVDTGMGRLGVSYDKAKNFIQKIKSLRHLDLEGIFTHFPLADTDINFTHNQIKAFNKLILDLEREGIKFRLQHAANSMGLIGFPQSHFNMVRPGLVVYGIYPKKNLDIKLKPVLSLKTKVVFLNRFPQGKGISYGHIYTTKKDTTVVNLPIGYGDGYPRNLSNIGPVLIRGKRFVVSGRICMDQTLVDVGNLKVRLADEVVLIGRQGREKILAEELARLSGTIPYEIVCGIGSRVPRIYLGKLSNKIEGETEVYNIGCPGRKSRHK
ncbi:MAG: alanine racemase [Candidatus Omnitrophica bacterium]|nr:alanine racemase [Candidatus Omnitrophota bacterium]